MSHFMRCSVTLLRPAIKLRFPGTNTLITAKRSSIQPFASSRTMNTLQEASKIYNAFKKGGPSFGGWQVFTYALKFHSFWLMKSLRCFQARIMLAQLLALEWTGCALTLNMETLMVTSPLQASSRGSNSFTDAAMHEAVVAIAKEGVSPIVRIAANEAWMVKRALDSGAHGIVVPLIYTVEDAKRLASSARFPPEGHRGFGSPLPVQCFNDEGMAYYLQHANTTLQTIVQIETASALAHVQEIAAIPGIDCLLIGPFDLGNNIGRPILGEMHQDLKDAIEAIKEAAHAAGKKVGIYTNSGEEAKAYADRGFDMISILTDQMCLTQAFKQSLAVASGQAAGSGSTKVKGYDGK